MVLKIKFACTELLGVVTVETQSIDLKILGSYHGNTIFLVGSSLGVLPVMSTIRHTSWKASLNSVGSNQGGRPLRVYDTHMPRND